MNNKRIGYVLKRYPRYSETFVVNEILAHEASGLEIEIFSLLPPNDEHFQDTLARVRGAVHYLSAEGLKAAEFWSTVNQVAEVIPNLWPKLQDAETEDVRYVYQALLLSREVLLKKIDHLHSHFASAATTVTRLASIFSGVPYSFTAHAKDIYHETVRHEDLERKLSTAAAVVTVSQYNLNYLCENFEEANSKVHCIYNGLNLEALQYQSPEIRPALIVAVGRLVEKKGFSDLIDACYILNRKQHNFCCQIIGTGELEAQFISQIENLNLQNKVQLLGPLPQSEVIQHLQNAAVMAAPCVIGQDGNRDGLPTVLLEAMAVGTPCISTDVTGIPEVVEHMITGLTVSQHNPEALADCLELLLYDSQLRVRLSEQAREKIERDFDIRKNSLLMRQLFFSNAAIESYHRMY